jgi:hypothetical protein
MLATLAVSARMTRRTVSTTARNALALPGWPGTRRGARRFGARRLSVERRSILIAFGDCWRNTPPGRRSGRLRAGLPYFLR